MKIKNTTTGEFETLTIIDKRTGQEWTADLLTNYGAKMDYDKENDLYLMAGDDFYWWRDVVSRYQANDDMVVEIVSYLSDELLENFISDLYDIASTHPDLDIYVDAVKKYLDDFVDSALSVPVKQFDLVKTRAGERKGIVVTSFYSSRIDNPIMLKEVRSYLERWLDGYNNSLTLEEIVELLEGFNGNFSYDVFSFELVEEEK